MSANYTWSLDEFYKSFDTDEFKNDLEKLKLFKDDFLRFTEEELISIDKPYEKIKKYIGFINESTNHLGLYTYCYLTVSVETDSTMAIKNLNKIQTIYAELSKVGVLFQDFLKRIDNLTEIIEQNEDLKEYEFVLKEYKEFAKYKLTTEEEVLYSKIRLTGSAAWEKSYNRETSALTADYIDENGEVKKLTISEVRRLQTDKNPTVRKNAFEAEFNSYKPIEKRMAESLNSIKGEAIIIAKKRGYNSVLDMVLKNNRLEKETLDAMFEAIKESSPKFTAYLKHKAKLLGDENGIKTYNLSAPVGSIEMKFTYEEAIEYVISNFRKYSDKLADYAKMAYEKRWLDVYPKVGKRSGAYCMPVPSHKESRFFLNFTGNFSSVLTLAHELGHGYHNYCKENLSRMNTDVPMPLAETASTFCEALVHNEALKAATNEEKIFILDNMISRVIQICVGIHARYLFENVIMQKIENETLSAEEFKSIMEESIKEAYCNNIDTDTINSYAWIATPHYYFADRHYYNFPYAYGQLFATGLYSMYLSEGKSFVEKYDKILEATGNRTLKDVGLLCGIDVSDKNFWKKSLKITEDAIDEFLALKL